MDYDGASEMTLDRRTALLASVGAAMVGGATARAAVQGGTPFNATLEPDEMINLWPDNAPGMPATPPTEAVVERSKDPAQHDRAIMGVTRPRLAVFRPAKPNGAALVVFPGGGYVRLAYDKEGYDIARALAPRGITVFVLLYRLPGDGWADRADIPLQDAQRAMRVIRATAARHGIDPARVAAMGFSAGGHLCADLAARFAVRTYGPVDAADRLSALPMLAAPVYPVVSMAPPLLHLGSRDALLGADPTAADILRHSPDRNIRADGPPCFLCAADDDHTVPIGNTLLLHAALRSAAIPVDLHIFEQGGHGFGLRGVRGRPASAWLDLFLAWSRAKGWF